MTACTIHPYLAPFPPPVPFRSQCFGRSRPATPSAGKAGGAARRAAGVGRQAFACQLLPLDWGHSCVFGSLHQRDHRSVAWHHRSARQSLALCGCRWCWLDARLAFFVKTFVPVVQSSTHPPTCASRLSRRSCARAGGGRQRKFADVHRTSAPRKHMAPIDRTGSCKCGKIEFQVKGDPIFNGYCHCRVCSRCANSSPVRARRREAE